MPLDPNSPSYTGSFGVPRKTEDTPFFDLWDTLEAVPRGVVGAAKGAWNTADWIAGDALPDWNDNPLGESTSTVGGLVEGLSQFAAGFAVANPVVGALGRVTGLTEAGAGLLGTGRLATVAGKLGQGLAAGALTDAVVWDAHQGRLSDLIQSVPALQNPINEYLASDPNDTEAEGRLKNVLEGAGLGALFNATFLGIKKLAAYNKGVNRLVEEAGGAAKVDEAKAAEIRAWAAKEAEAKVPQAEVKDAFDAAHGSEAIVPASDVQLGDTLAAREADAAAPRTPEERAAYADKLEADQKTLEDSILGDKASAWRRSMAGNGRKAEEIEAALGLTQAQKDQLAGIGERTASVESLRRINEAVSYAESAQTADEIATSLSSFLKKIKPREGQDLRLRNPAELAGIQASMDKAEKLGLDGQGVLDSALKKIAAEYSDPEDAKFVLEQIHSALSGPVPPKALPASAASLRTSSPSAVPTPGPAAPTPGPVAPEVPAASFFNKHAPLFRAGLSMTDDQVRQLAGFMADKGNIEKAALELGVNPRNMSGADLLAAGLAKHAANLEHMKMGDTAVAFARANEVIMRDAAVAFHPGLATPKTWDETLSQGMRIYRDLVGSPDGNVGFARAARGLAADTLEGAMHLDARLTGVRITAVSLANGCAEHLDRILAMGLGNEDALTAELLRFKENADLYNHVMAHLDGVKNELGRANNSLKIDIHGQALPGYVSDLTGNPARLRELLQQQGGMQHVLDQVRAARAAFGNGGLEGAMKFGRIAKAMAPTKFQRALNMTLEFFTNSILSGPKTAVVNGAGPAAFSFYRPLEALAGNTLLNATSKGRAAQSGVAAELLGQISGMSRGLLDTIHLTKELGFNAPDVFGTGAGSGALDLAARRNAITAANAGLDANTWAGKAVEYFGNTVRVPSRALGTTDNVIKLLNFRAAAESRLRVQYAKDGLRGTELEQKVFDTMDRLIWKNQVQSSQNLWERGLEEAQKRGMEGVEAKLYAGNYAAEQRTLHPTDGALTEFGKGQAWESTMTTPAAVGSWSWSLQGLVGRHPMVRLVIPFINTPLNIMKAAGQRLDPIGPAAVLLNHAFPEHFAGLADLKNRFVQDMVKGDARQKAEAIGRISVGMSAATTMYTLAQAGYVTGRGPNNPAQKKTMVQAGWMPYSFKVGDSYVSYQRMDPLAGIIGISADLVNYAAYAPPEEQGNIESITMGLAVALANNLTNKTYTAGLANFLDAARDPDKNLAGMVRSYVATGIPNVLGQGVGAAGDDVTHEIRTWADALIAKVPGLSQTLPPARNVLGEPIERPMAVGGEWGDWWLPVAYNRVSDDSIARELAALGHGFTPMRRTMGTLDMSEAETSSGQNAYDRLGELTGTVTIQGMRLRDAIRRRIAAPDYQRAAPEAVGEAVSPRVGMLNGVIAKYRDAAYRQLLRESPAVLANDKQMRANKLAATSGNPLSILPQ